MSKGTDLIAAERARQMTDEGYTAEHDAGHADELRRAAGCYLVSAAAAADGRVVSFTTALAFGWPWEERYWKPTGDPVRDFTKAGALAAAAIDSLGEPQ